MIDRLVGSISPRAGVDLFSVRLHEIGYCVRLPARDAARVMEHPGFSGGLNISAVTRDGATELFGFFSVEDRDWFDRLLKIPQVGPSTALALISKMTAKEFDAAVAKPDLAALTSVHGVGKKTAERILDHCVK